MPKNNRKVFVFENRKANPKKVYELGRVKKGQFFYMEEKNGDLVVDDFEKEGNFIFRALREPFKSGGVWGIKAKSVA